MCESGSSLGSSVAAMFGCIGKGRCEKMGLAMMCVVQFFCFGKLFFVGGALKFWLSHAPKQVC